MVFLFSCKILKTANYIDSFDFTENCQYSNSFQDLLSTTALLSLIVYYIAVDMLGLKASLNEVDNGALVLVSHNYLFEALIDCSFKHTIRI